MTAHRLRFSMRGDPRVPPRIGDGHPPAGPAAGSEYSAAGRAGHEVGWIPSWLGVDVRYGRNPNLVYFTDSEAVGGAEHALATLVSALDRERWRPLLYHHGGAGIRPLVEELGRLGVPEATLPRISRKGDVGALATLVVALRRCRPLVFHANLNSPNSCTFALLGAALARVPAVVATQHYGRIPSARKRPRQRLALHGVDRFIAVSHDTADRLRRSLGGEPSRVVVVHNGIAFERFDGPEDRQPRTRRGPAVALSVGRLVAGKGYRFLLEAAVGIPGLRVVLAGDGPDRGALEAYARSLAISERTVFAGRCQDVPDLLSSCDVFVLPSLFEGHPLSVLEAMAAGKPVVASDAGGTREAVAHGETGLLVPPGDPQALAAAVLRILRDPGLARRMGLAGRRRVQNEFSAQLMAQRVCQIYDELLETAA